MKRILHWFRADLRIEDNTALQHAIEHADEVIGIFIITPKTWERHDAAACKIDFILKNLEELSETLNARGIPLLIRQTPTFEGSLEILERVCHEHQIDALYFNHQYEWDEQQRDAKIIREMKIPVDAYHDQLVFAPGEILNKQSQPFKVFTPFKKAWLMQASHSTAWMPMQNSRKKFQSNISRDEIPTTIKEFNNPLDISDWPAGEKKAKQRLKEFILHHAECYNTERDFPMQDGTSKLSAYLAQGVISVRQCIDAMMQHHNVQQPEQILKYQGTATWLSELIWREFYKQIAFHFPRVCRNKPFLLDTETIPWRTNDTLFQAWCEGKTGFPIVDAAMRQLNQTGWMHNRLRMITAMFLCKTLFLDWRMGEKYFMSQLIDGDFTANNGGWQWCASTGTDAAPYFRIFNPTTQSERFDPDGEFIRHYCPELRRLDNKRIHNPYAKDDMIHELNYPKPIVDYSKMRKLVIDTFKKAKS
ncbi:MAG: deoxyribodipyrimidine photo-lyase [Gammaproteobacteria bacterium]